MSLRNPYPFHKNMSAARIEQLLMLRLGAYVYRTMQYKRVYEWRFDYA